MANNRKLRTQIKVRLNPHPKTGAGRYLAYNNKARIHLEINDSLSPEQNRDAAAAALATKLGWLRPQYLKYENQDVGPAVYVYAC